MSGPARPVPADVPAGPRPPRLVLRLLLILAIVAAAGAIVEHHGSFALLRFAVHRDPLDMPSAHLVPREEIVSGLPVLSLYVAPKDLHDPATGLLANKLEHGRDWERPGTMSFYEHGRLRLSTPVGVRKHGGGSRITVPEPGFRLYFRRQYGAPEAPPGAVFDAPHDRPLRRLVVHNDVRREQGIEWRLINPLAYDIATAIGAITAATKPARLFLNGEFVGVYVLKEHFHERDWFETHWGHPVRLDWDEFEEVWAEILALEPPRMREVGRLIDLDNMTRWFIATIFCATFDAFQGPGQYRDPTRATAQWFFVSWDMDWSFRDWEHDSFYGLTERIGQRRRGRRANEPRAYLFTRLLAEDPEYREFFKRIWVDAMNHRIPQSFLWERFHHYRAIALQYGIEDLRFLDRVERFLHHRPAFVRELAEQWLNTPPSVRCRLEGAEGKVRLDGWAVEPGFEGYYFPGMTLRLEIADDARPRFSHWVVNGEEVRASELTLTAERDLEIEAIWRHGT